MKIEDPLSYVDRYNMPTLVINAGGDEFFLPDDQYVYVLLSLVTYYRCVCVSNFKFQFSMMMMMVKTLLAMG
jgi:PhoPQ-activated pathogenicity-related protein